MPTEDEFEELEKSLKEEVKLILQQAKAEAQYRDKKPPYIA